MNREFLMLAHDYDPDKDRIAGWFWSEKLDGMRCFWDGGITRGIPAAKIPWANVEKHGRLKEEVISTGLWSRYAQVLRAPEWWTNQLPEGMTLDGELYLGPQQFEKTMSIVKKHKSDEWAKVKFHTFDTPALKTVLGDGRINNNNFKKEFSGIYGDYVVRTHGEKYGFEFNSTAAYSLLGKIANDIVVPVPQTRLPLSTQNAYTELDAILELIDKRKGEGIMLRHPGHIWEPIRTRFLVKVKKTKDAEATVIGYVWGRDGKEGRLSGKLGALICEYKGHRFNLSGFTMPERVLEARKLGAPGTEAGPDVKSYLFPVGSKVTFRYRELTVAGAPKEARYWRRAE